MKTKKSEIFKLILTLIVCAAFLLAAFGCASQAVDPVPEEKEEAVEEIFGENNKTEENIEEIEDKTEEESLPEPIKHGVRIDGKRETAVAIYLNGETLNGIIGDEAFYFEIEEKDTQFDFSFELPGGYEFSEVIVEGEAKIAETDAGNGYSYSFTDICGDLKISVEAKKAVFKDMKSYISEDGNMAFSWKGYDAVDYYTVAVSDGETEREELIAAGLHEYVFNGAREGVRYDFTFTPVWDLAVSMRAEYAESFALIHDSFYFYYLWQYDSFVDCYKGLFLESKDLIISAITERLNAITDTYEEAFALEKSLWGTEASTENIIAYFGAHIEWMSASILDLDEGDLL